MKLESLATILLIVEYLLIPVVLWGLMRPLTRRLERAIDNLHVDFGRDDTMPDVPVDDFVPRMQARWRRTK